jgi:DNA mismatch endonuclease (patch repair protein)
MDTISPERRSAVMARIRGRDTKPEMIVRRLAHAMGYRFRLHRRDFPGSPDLVFSPRRKVVFVHGCYWHRHPGCQFAYSPKSNTEFWTRKFDSNIARDQRVEEELEQLGWDVLTIWECEASEAVLEFLTSDLLKPQGLETSMASLLTHRDTWADRRRRHMTELRERAVEAEAKLRRLYDAVENGAL